MTQESQQTMEHYGMILDRKTRVVGHLYSGRIQWWFYTVADAQFHPVGHSLDEAKQRIVEEFGKQELRLI